MTSRTDTAMGELLRYATVASGLALMFALVWTAGPSASDEPAGIELSHEPAFSGAPAASPFGIAGRDDVAPSAVPIEAPAPMQRSLAAEVDRLMRSADARDAFAAYTLIDACLRAKDAESVVRALPVGAENQAIRQAQAASPERSELLCGDLTSAQIAGRLSLLERAAAAAVPGAAVALVDEGPFGDRSALEQRPDDPLVIDWKRHVVELMQAAAQQGDRAAMVALSNAYQGALAERDPQRALAWWVAQTELTRIAGGRVSRADSRVGTALRASLSAEQAAAAVEQGQKLATACCRKQPS